MSFGEVDTLNMLFDKLQSLFDESQGYYESFLDTNNMYKKGQLSDKEFFEKWGKPKISLYSSDRNSGYLTSEKDGTSFGVSIKIFRPGENDRISTRN